jgi:membrane protease YdiL (CAAX protease family)
MQMGGMLAFAFALPMISSILILVGSSHPQPVTRPRLLFTIVFELVILGCLYGLLRWQGRGFQSLGFSFIVSLRDCLHSVGLFVGAYLAMYVAYLLVLIFYVVINGHPPSPWQGQATVFGSTASVFALVLCFINPFFEELLVRAFVITEVEYLSGSVRVAVVASVLLQSAYHLYQGVPNALSLGAGFAVVSVYFARTRRILPVILAHMYFDVMGVLVWVHRLPG